MTLVEKHHNFVKVERLSVQPIKNTDYEEDTVFIFNTYGIKKHMAYMVMSIILMEESASISIDDGIKYEIKKSGLYMFDTSKIDFRGNRDIHITGFGKFILANIGLCDRCLGCSDSKKVDEILKVKTMSEAKESNSTSKTIEIKHPLRSMIVGPSGLGMINNRENGRLNKDIRNLAPIRQKDETDENYNKRYEERKELFKKGITYTSPNCKGDLDDKYDEIINMKDISSLSPRSKVESDDFVEIEEE